MRIWSIYLSIFFFAHVVLMPFGASAATGQATQDAQQEAQTEQEPAYSVEELQQLLQLLAAQAAQQEEGAREQEPDEIAPNVRLAAGLYALWRKGIEVKRYHNSNLNNTKLDSSLDFLDTFMVGPIGSLAAVWEKLIEWGFDDLEKLQNGMTNNPSLPYHIQAVWRDAYNNSSFYEKRFSLWQQIAIKFAPALAYHYGWMKCIDYCRQKADKGIVSFFKDFDRTEMYNHLQGDVLSATDRDKREVGGYKTSSYKAALLGYKNMFDARSETDHGRDGEFVSVAEERFAHSCDDKSWYVPQFWHAYKKRQAEKEWEEFQDVYFRAKGNWKSPLKEDERSRKITDSRLYRTAVQSSATLVASKIDNYLSDKLKEKYGAAKIAEVEGKTYGAISPQLLWPLCKSVANVMIHMASEQVHDKDSFLNATAHTFFTSIAKNVIPEYDKLQLGIGESRTYEFVKNRRGRRYYDKHYVSREIGYGEYIAKEMATYTFINIGAYTLPRFIRKVIDNRRSIASWVNGKLQSFGNFFVRIGVCSKNPVNRLGSALNSRAAGMFRTNPSALYWLLFMTKMVQAQERGDVFSRLIKGDSDALEKMAEENMQYDDIIQKLEHATSLEYQLELLQTDALLIRDDERYQKYRARIDEELDQATQLLEERQLMPKVIESVFVLFASYMQPFSRSWGMTYGRKLAGSLGRGYRAVFGEPAYAGKKRDDEQGDDEQALRPTLLLTYPGYGFPDRESS